MKFFIILSLTVLSSSAFSSSTTKLIAACERVGTQKIVEQLRYFNVEADLTSIKECGVDNRAFNVSAYVWFCGSSTGGEKTVRMLTQKPLFKDCF